MKTIIIYPLPFDRWEDFEAPVMRFIKTFKENPPGSDYELRAMCCWGEPSEEVRKAFYGTKVKFLPHYGVCDCIATHQSVAQCEEGKFLVCLSTRTFFHRPGWLLRLKEARDQYGPGLYSSAASRETGYTHLCNRLYAIDSHDLRNYPWEIQSRSDASQFEAGQRSITGMMAHYNRPLKVVYWDGAYEMEEAIGMPNTFRMGNQEQLLSFDRHTELWKESDESKKKELTSLMLGV